MLADVDMKPHLEALNDLFTRAYYSAAGYVFESQPYAVAPDADALDALSAIRREDRRHAQLLAGVIDDLEAVPLAGAFPYWYRDLNYLSVPYLSDFVVQTLREDVERYAAVLAALPASVPGAKATLSAIRREKVGQLERLEPLARAALAREAADGQAKIQARKAARQARLAKERAAKEAAKKAAAKPTAAKPAPGAAAPVLALDPNEAGITPKERARRQMMAKRGAAAPGGAPVAAVAAAAPAAAGLDPNEAGITPKERARRQMLAKRGAAAPTTPAAAPAEAPVTPPAPPVPSADDLDPDEEGIGAKEKARRTMLRKRRAANR